MGMHRGKDKTLDMVSPCAPKENFVQGMSENGSDTSDTVRAKSALPFLNLRIFAVCAIGAAAGIFAYARIRFGGFRASDLLFLPVFAFSVFPLSKRRIAILLSCFLLFAGLGAGVMHLYTARYESGPPTGVYTVTGTVDGFAVLGGYTIVELKDVTLDGEKTGGKLQASVASDAVRPGDILSFSARVTRLDPDPDSYEFAEDIRRVAYPDLFWQTDRSSDPFLLLRGHLYDVLHENMEKAEADVSFALLTGNSRMVDGGFMDAVRAGGIAHIFAVSGLHIGIFFGAVALVFRFLKKYAFLPALLFAFLYCALCGFSVSCLRALIMCAVLSINTFFGRKNDLLLSAGFAAALVLLLLPAQFFAAGFRLSFGACIGLGLFSGSLSRLLRRIRLLPFLADLLSASFSVMLFTFPILMESFGYFPLWGLLLNLLFVPLLPFAFLELLICTTLSLILPFAAGFFLMFPEGLFAILLLFFSFGETNGLLCGFSLGAGGIVWLTASVLLSERFRMKAKLRGLCTAVAAVLFVLCLLSENAVFLGCRIQIDKKAQIALVRTRESAVLIVGDTNLAAADDFLMRHYGGKIDGAILLYEDSTSVGAAVFSGAGTLYTRDEIVTGLQNVQLVAGDTVRIGEMLFRFERAGKLLLTAENCTAEFDFEGESAFSPDLFVHSGMDRLNFLLICGIIVTL